MMREFLGGAHLKNGGGGGDPARGMCVMELVDWLAGAEGRLTDHPQTACPVLTEFAISLNDCAPSVKLRDTLKPLAILLVGTRDPARAWARADYLVRECIARLIAPADAGLAAAARSDYARHSDQDPQSAFCAVTFLLPKVLTCVRRRSAAAHLGAPSERWRTMRSIFVEVLLLDAPSAEIIAFPATPRIAAPGLLAA